MDTAKCKQFLDRGNPAAALKRLGEALQQHGWYDLKEQVDALLSRLNDSQRKTLSGLRSDALDDKTVQQVSAASRELLAQFEDRLHRLKTEGVWVDEDDVAISLYMRGQKELTAGNASQAIAFFTQTLDEAPLFAEAYVERGIAYTKLAPPDYPAALKDFNRALRQYPGMPTALLNRGIVYYTFVEDYPKACKDWKQAYDAGLEVAKSYIDQYCKP